MDIDWSEVVRYLTAQSGQIALLTVAVAAVAFALRHRSAHVRYLLWLIVVAKCLVPPLHVVPLRVLPATVPGEIQFLLPSPRGASRVPPYRAWPCLTQGVLVYGNPPPPRRSSLPAHVVYRCPNGWASSGSRVSMRT